MRTTKLWSTLACTLGLALLAVLGACDDDSSSTQSDGDTQSDPTFTYTGCLALKDAVQYPTPAWEKAANTMTGVLLAPPNNDKAASVLDAKTRSQKWRAELSKADGFPLMGTWFIALSDEADAVDNSKIRLFAWNDSGVTEVSDFLFTSELSEDKRTLVLDAKRPLKPLGKGERYILALYEGVASGSQALPACEDEKAHQDYVDAAVALLKASKGDNLELALPFTTTRLPLSHRALYEHLTQTPALEVKELTAKSVATDFEEIKYPASAETKAVLQDTAYVGYFSTPLYQNNDMLFENDPESGLPTKKGETEPGFLLLLPKNGTAPYPFVLFQHGGSRTPLDLFTVAKPYAEAGIALLGIDLPYHGHRAAPGTQGSDLDMADFDSPMKTRDNFRQASADHLAVLTGIAAINDALKTPSGIAVALDNTKAFYMGHSMGSLSGTLTSSVADVLSGTSLLAGGAPYKLLMSDGYFNVMLTGVLSGRSALEKKLIYAFIQTLMDGGDPINFPTTQENSALRPKDVLIWESNSDPVVINPATDLQALLFGAVQAKPFVYDIPEMESLDDPIENNFSFAADSQDKATRVIKQIDHPGLSSAQIHMQVYLDEEPHSAAAACFSGRIANGVCSFQTP